MMVLMPFMINIEHVQDRPVWLAKVDYKQAQEIGNPELDLEHNMTQPQDHLTEKSDRYRRLLPDALSTANIVPDRS